MVIHIRKRKYEQRYSFLVLSTTTATNDVSISPSVAVLQYQYFRYLKHYHLKRNNITTT
nr:MAG TPA: hypothetical protein [Caudoviricetes sp.]